MPRAATCPALGRGVVPLLGTLSLWRGAGARRWRLLMSVSALDNAKPEAIDAGALAQHGLRRMGRSSAADARYSVAASTACPPKR